MANQMVLKKVQADSFLYDVVAISGLENGHIVKLGAMGTNGVYACAAPAAITDLEIVIVADVPINYDASKVENDYTITVGEAARTYVPYKGQKMAFPVANFDTTVTPVAGSTYVIPVAGATKMKVAVALGGTESVAWKVDELFTKAGVSMMTIRCIKA